VTVEYTLEAVPRGGQPVTRSPGRSRLAIRRPLPRPPDHREYDVTRAAAPREAPPIFIMWGAPNGHG
jgi:hypothetical protein